MAPEMKIEIVKKETIKPSSPTPHNLKSFKLSLLDKLADASTLSTFIKVWAATALGLGHTVVPDFSAATRYPPRDFSAQSPAAAVEMKIVKCVAKRFVFDGPKMRALKAKVTSGSVQRPTRVEAVTGLIWNCARKASKLSSGISKLSMVSQSVNIRKRVVPRLPQTSIGNLVGYYTAMAEESGIELNSMELVSRLRKGMVEFNENHPKRLQGDNVFEAICEYFKEIGNIMRRDDINLFICTSLCNFGIYETDFGWGKPIWVSIPGGVVKNVAILIDTKEGDGVDAWISLSEEDMALFERDPELLAFASFNPSVFGPVTRRSSL